MVLTQFFMEWKDRQIPARHSALQDGDRERRIWIWVLEKEFLSLRHSSLESICTRLFHFGPNAQLSALFSCASYTYIFPKKELKGEFLMACQQGEDETRSPSSDLP